jgi:hypothetical protein
MTGSALRQDDSVVLSARIGRAAMVDSRHAEDR